MMNTEILSLILEFNNTSSQGIKSFKVRIGKKCRKKKVLNFSLVGTIFSHYEWKPLIKTVKVSKVNQASFQMSWKH